MPTTVQQKLAWVEVRGAPDYLELAGMRRWSCNGEPAYGYPPVSPENHRLEIQNVYQEAFAQAGPGDRARVLRSYATQFPHLAFEQHSWLWPLWQEWRARHGAVERQLLGALANGIKAKAMGWLSARRSRDWMLGQAKRRLEHLRTDEKLKGLYVKYRDGARSHDPEVRVASETRYLRPIIDRIRELSGYSATPAELVSLRLSGVLRLAAARPIGVRERDLH